MSKTRIEKRAYKKPKCPTCNGAWHFYRNKDKCYACRNCGQLFRVSPTGRRFKVDN